MVDNPDNNFKPEETVDSPRGRLKILLSQLKAVYPFIVLMGVLVGMAWLMIWQANVAKATLSRTNSALEASANSASLIAKNANLAKAEELSASEHITELGADGQVQLKTAGDETSLPDITPESFVSYMRQLLLDNTPDGDGCVILYTISRISPVNISGTTGRVKPDSADSQAGCGGGSGTFWYFKDNKWQDINTQGGIECTLLQETTISREFVDVCQNDNLENTADDQSAEQPNPNGALVDLLP